MSSTDPTFVDPKFERILLELGESSPDRTLLRFVAEFAKLIGADLHGLLIQDERLACITGSPSLREFQSLQRAWRQRSAQDVMRDLERHAALMREEIRAIAAAVGVPQRCETAPAKTMTALLEAMRATDILVVAEPARPLDQAMSPFADLAMRGLNAPATVLLVPSPIARRQGAVLALAQGPEDPALRRAAMIARISNAPLVTYDMRSEAQILFPPGIAGQHGERLIVMSRLALDDRRPLMAAQQRRVPVLALKPPRAQPRQNHT